jgi:protein TonB
MNFSKQQADPRRHLVGIAFVVLFHAFIVWALVSGLAKKVVEVVRAPIETKVIEEIKKPPPPPEVVMPPPPKLEAPPPPFIPPPEVQVAAPPPEPTISATTPTPPAPVPFTPIAPQAPAPAPPAPVQAGVACSKMVNFAMPTIPASSTVTSGNLIYLASVKDGKITSFEITSIRLEGGNDQRVRRSFITNAEAAVRQYVCSGNAVITQEFVFKLE